MTASNLKIKGGTINIGSKFSVDAEGNVNATALSLRGGSISLGSKFSVSSDGTMKATGAEFSGNITATSGYIGSTSSGFNIGSNSIWNGTAVIGGLTYKKNVFNQDQVDGIYVGTDGIALGKGKFKVDKYGKLKATNIEATGGTIGGFQITSDRIQNMNWDTVKGIWIATVDTGKCFQIGNNFKVNVDGDIVANNGTFTGTLTVGNTTITADQLRVGAKQSYDNYTIWNGTTSTVNTNSPVWNGTASTVSTNSGNWGSAFDWTSNNGSYCVNGAGNGNHAYSRAQSAWIGSYRLNFGYGITILGSEFTDGNGDRCSGYASRSNVVTCEYAGDY